MEDQTFFAKELYRIREICFSNTHQLQLAIDTKNFIDTNFDAAINLDLIAHLKLTSKFHLIRVFKQYYGLTPHQYLILTRIRKAKELLASGMNVSETCYGVGFESIHSFSTLFRKKTGKTPSQYRKAIFDT